MATSAWPKIDYVKSTLSNIIRYVAKLSEAEVYIRVDAFNARIKTIIDVVHVTPENAEELCEIVKSIKVKDQTNIELALENAKQITEEYTLRMPEHNVHHVFLTDGDANMGNMDPKYLSTIIRSTKTTSNVFIGVGTDHNARMLQEFGTCERCDYRFIDNSENTGIIYGEVMERILRPAMKDVRLSIQGGELFDWTQGNWTTELTEWTIDSESNKTYHLRRVIIAENTETMRTEPVSVLVQGKAWANGIMIDVNHVVRESCVLVDEPVVDLTRYMFRHRVLNLLFECRISQYRRSTPLKQCIADAFREQRIYMREKGLMTDIFMCTLCEDLVVAYRSIGTDFAQLYCASRESSQAKQETFTPKMATRDPDHIGLHFRRSSPVRNRKTRFHSPPPPPLLERMVAMNQMVQLSTLSGSRTSSEDSQDDLQRELLSPLTQNDPQDSEGQTVDEDLIDNYVMDTTVNMNDFAYTTPTRLTSMRMCSQPMDIDDEDVDEETQKIY